MAENKAKPSLGPDVEKQIKSIMKKGREKIREKKARVALDFSSLQDPSPSLVGTGASIFLDQNSANSVTQDTRNIVAMAPEATILVKKKAFSSLKGNNDVRFMDKTEKMLLRATKALFAYKVQQVRAYESLTKFENHLSISNEFSLNLLSSFINEGSLFDIDKLGTVEEYVAERIEAWYDQKQEMMQVTGPDGNTGYSMYDSSTGQYVYITEEQMQDLNDGTYDIDEDGIPEISLGRDNYLEIPLLTNRQYLQTLSASEAKKVLEEKKNEFEAEYEKTGTDGFAAALNSLEYDGEGHDDIGDGGFTDTLGDVGSAMAAGVASALAGYSAEGFDAYNEDIAKVLRRNAFSVDNHLTTWIVDPDDPNNYTIGPGTGVIELTTFNTFNTSTNYDSQPAGAAFTLTYPYRIGTILEDDIELAIEEALNGTVGILDELVNGGLTSQGMATSMPPIDAESIISAAVELGGAGSLDSSLDTDYIRERMRTFYLGKPLVSPPDPVHFYIRGNRSFKDYTSRGAYPEETSESPFDEEYMEIDSAILKAEHQLYTNQAMDIDMYREIRGRQDNSFGMIHVFGGYITNTSENYSGGFWTLNASCTDNMSWLKWSRFAITPALSDPQGILEDPLTPFELMKDELGEVIGSERDLLYENKSLLQSGMLSYDSGILAGQNATEGNLLQGQYNGIGSLDGKKVLQHPGGFVYRWKTGIITATAGFQVVDPTGENQSVINQFTQNYSVTAAKDVLNNLDIPNILSILIVGQPYNVETFMEQSFAAHNKSNKSTSFAAEDPLTGVVDAVRKQNSYFGNFHPYRMLTISSSTAEQMINQAGVRELANSQVKSLQKRKVKIRKKMRSLQKAPQEGQIASLPIAALVATLQAEIDTIDAAIENQILVGNQYSSALTSADDVGIEINLFGPSIGLPEYGNEEENHDVNRAMMLVGAQRRIEDVRLNRDRNLFIVSDQYDSADIRPFILSLNSSGFPLFKGEFIDVHQKCVAATAMLNLEFFCNSQGHLEFRPPVWNRTPLSVLKEVIQTQEETSRSIMPAFITNLFQTRIEGLYLSIHTLNVKLVLLALMMGRFPDNTLIPNMQVSGLDALDFFGVEVPSDGGVFGMLGNLFGSNSASSETASLGLKQREFTSTSGDITESNNSLFGNGLKVTASFQDSGDILDADTETLLGIFDPIFQEETGVVNDIMTAASSSGSGSSLSPPAVNYAKPENLNSIRDSFKSEFGRDPAQGIGIDLKKGFQEKDFVFKGKDLDELEAAVIGSSGLLQKFKKAISQRDSYVSMLQANLTKQQELEEITGILTSGESEDEADVSEGLIGGWAVEALENVANAAQNAIDIITGDAQEGTMYDHLIEDDTRNLLGYGSGKRFILKDEYILNATFTENPPEFTRVDVKGDAPLGMGNNLNQGTDGLYFWAGATDFDLWRQYGYVGPKEISVPFISDAEGQARPYAILELILQKMNINRGEITIAGNEFYQPGDTIYIPMKGLLYYVRTVSHNFSYSGQNFTTNLSLIYGHPPGEYLPSPLDIIGQDLVSNFLEDPALVYRTSEADDSYRVLKPDSTLVFPTDGADAAGLLSYSDNQVRFENMMIDLSGSMMGSKYVLVRGFVKDSEASTQNVSEKMAVVRSLLEDPSQVTKTSSGSSTELASMRLPNNMPVTAISSEKIIEQISYLTRDDETDPLGEIKCLDRKLHGAFYADGNLDTDAATGIFPKGGPNQNSWLDFRDEIIGFNFSGEINAIEVGIIDVPNSVLE